MLRFSSRLLLVRDAAYPGMSSLGQGRNSHVITKTTICSACAIPQQCGTVLMFQLNCSGIFCRGHGVDGSSEPSSSSERSAVWTSPAVCSFESQLLTEDGATVDPSNGPWHGDVRSGEPRDPMFRFSSKTMKMMIRHTVEEVAKHNKKGDAWVVLHGRILNVSNLLSLHPGGKLAILTFSGKDAAAEFDMIQPPVMRSLMFLAAASRKRPRELRSRPCLLPLIRVTRLQIWRLREDGGFRRHARSPFVDPSFVRECLLLFDSQHHL